jgi:DNA-binding CsgD family transcriptional regulator/predicted enzyme related to lactoylglutathione lyase
VVKKFPEGEGNSPFGLAMMPRMRRGPGRPPAPDVLTPSEWEVVHMVRHGMTNRRIALQRNTTVDAVKFHLDNIREKLALPNRQAIRHWSGLPLNHRSNEMMTQTDVALGHIGQVGHTVKDIDAATMFFRDTLGMKYLYTFGQLAFFDCDGTRLFVTASEESQGHGNSVLYFSVADIHASTAALKEKGVAFTGEPHLIHRHGDGTEEWMAFFSDPEGNTLALMSAVKPG